MKVLPFTIPTSHDKTILVQDDIIPFFYPHLHCHEEIQLTYILKGEGTLLVGSSMHAFNANEVYLIGANVPHVFKSDASYFNSDKEVHALTIFFNTKGKLASLFDLPELKNVYSFFSSCYSGIRIPQESFQDISSRILSIQYANGMDQIMQFFHLLKSLSIIEDGIPLANDMNTNPKAYSDYEGKRISNIYNFILQHYNRDITLEEVAAEAYMTPQAFCRYFKKHTRNTFVTFLNDVRINEACKKLIDGSYGSVSSIAYDCGFNSITNFNRVFKTTTGKSPREYASVFLSNAN